ncbi:protein YIP4 [Rhypophila decipiens]
MDPRDQTFMTIHNLTPDANILFASDSIFDILGYQPDEVQGKSCFDYFHPKEVPFARSIHRRGVLLDKAAVLHYARILARNGEWVSCECCFTVVHDVLVACTSIYLRGTKSERRAIDAPQIRRIFSSSPRDPRYHMLEHLSPKFKMPSMEHEPRAALILNRFTRNLSIMFATNAVTAILGLRPDEIKDKAFYEIIQENCLQNAIQCLESAKANESIAYLRFNYRDPRVESNDGLAEENEGEGEEDGHEWERRTPAAATSLVPSSPTTAAGSARTRPGRSNGRGEPALELEAVVSCTSDGLVVVLRRARPPIPNSHVPLMPGFNLENEPYVPPELLYTFRPPLRPQYMPLRESVKAAGGPPIDQALRSIREAAVFAWPLIGINGNLAEYSHGRPAAGAQPPDGLPIWDPTAGPTEYEGPENYAANRHHRASIMAKTNEAPRLSYRHEAPDANPERPPRDYSLGLGSAAAPTWPSTPPSASDEATAAGPFSHSNSLQRRASQPLLRPPPGQAVEPSLNPQLPVEPWVEAVRSRSYNQGYTTPSPRAHSPSESPKDNRYLWTDLDDFDDPLQQQQPSSSSQRTPLTGTIGSSGSAGNSNTWTSRIPGEDRRAPTNTIDETVWETLRRDLLAIWSKMREVLYPKYLFGGTMFESEDGLRGAYANLRGAGLSGAREELAGLAGRVMDPESLLGGSNSMSPGLRDWDLWGPLIFCLVLSSLLSFSGRDEQRDIVFSGVFALIWIGEAVVTLQIKLLGGNISFAQSVCIIGYTLFPLVIAAFLSAVHLWWIIRIPVYSLLVLWSIAAGVSILGGSGVVKNRVGLAVYPLCVFYIGLGCLCFIS